jgi:hypothetical protein
MAIALGGLALVVAARTGESEQDAVTVDDSSDGGVVAGEGDGGSSSLPGLADDLPGLAGDQAVRLVDFADIDQPGETCSEGLEGETPGVIPVEQGESALLDPERIVRLEVKGAPSYGDLDGDGDDEAVVHAVCAYGANGAQDTVEVWDLDSGRPRAAASLAEAPASIESRFPPVARDVTIEDGEVVVTWDAYSERTPRCCPDRQAEVRYDLIGDQLLLTGAPETD